ncbi:hypothetical protein N7457_003396 [Penicillium paradoxum]|uniref:uncharacterized protein n=1 Tax=Penicillium paradoxum TaxID=176176 RepID=UPI002547B07C|nr:uncharacterized protein N7457_003396 [Penicillium paradoxum]KAJ5788406.1 hypothetical protein N7457_003396 [Penicillium paradoxum]
MSMIPDDIQIHLEPCPTRAANAGQSTLAEPREGQMELTGDRIIGSSKSYKSSEGVLRTFCGTCGATVFYTCAERPGIVDVAVGILRAPEGVMAENRALWRTGRIASADDGLKYEPGCSRALIEGVKARGRQRGMPEDLVIS